MQDEAELATNVRVAVRCRPLNTREKQNQNTSCLKIYPDQVVMIHPIHQTEEAFGFDLIFGENSTQDEVWEQVGVPILNKAIAGFNGTIFAYGQTGSGKTWSMQGIDEQRGIIPRLNHKLFDKIEEEKRNHPTKQFFITVSYFEIYNEILYDLLDSSDRKKRMQSAKGGLEIKEHPILGVYVKGLQEIVVESAGKLQAIVDQGMKNRTVASTQMNADSSRSHSIFMISVHQKDDADASKNIFAKINLVDLAGSERVGKTKAEGQTLKEGANINKSLSALSNVINALVEVGKGKSTFIPYRNSKLTRVLQESLGGNSVTTMLAALSPAAENFDETLSTLKYASRAKAIKVKAVKNEESSQVSRLNDEIRMLKEKLAQQPSGGNIGQAGPDEKTQQQLRELEEAMKSTWEAKSKLSKEYEEERKRLLQEQQVAAQQLQIAKERQWKILEERSNVEVTIAHAREVVKNQMGLWREADSEADNEKAMMDNSWTCSAKAVRQGLDERIDGWNQSVAKIASAEKTCLDQSTMMQVFQAAILRDSQQLEKLTQLGFRSKRIDDNQVNNLLKQLQEKLSLFLEEMKKWLSSIAALFDLYRHLLRRVHRFIMALQSLVRGNEASDEKDLLRGVSLIYDQIKQKRSHRLDILTRAVGDALAFHKFIEQLQEVVSGYRMMIQNRAGIESLSFLNSQSEGDDDKIEAAEREQLFSNLSRSLELAEQMKTHFLQLFDNTGGGDASDAEKSREIDFHVATDQCHYFAQLDSSNKEIPGEQETLYWKAMKDQSRSEFEERDDKNSLVVSLLEASLVQQLVISPGKWQQALLLPTDPQPPVEASNVQPLPSISRNSSQVSVGAMRLPSGLSLFDCDGDVSNTVKAMADVMDWTTLLKKHPPEKLLKRPPIRFLFDLFLFLSSLFPAFFPPEVRECQWSDIAEAKDRKILFFEKCIETVENRLHEFSRGNALVGENLSGDQMSPTAINILTGNEPEKTNFLLQRLAILLYFSKEGKSQSHELERVGMSANPSQVELPVSFKKTVVQRICTVKSVRVFSSPRGGQSSAPASDWEEVKIREVELEGGVSQIKFVVPVYTQYLKIIPIDFEYSIPTSSPPLPDGTFDHLPCFHLSIFGNAELISQASQATNVLKNAERSRVLETAFQSFSETLGTLLSFVQSLLRLEKREINRKQEAMKRSMEALALEKQALAQTLANEKQSLLSNNQDLQAQLVKVFQQLQETSALLEKEQAMNQQLSSLRLSLEEEKQQLLSSLSDKEEELSKLSTQSMKLTMAHDQAQQLIAQQQADLQQKEAEVDQLVQELQYSQRQRESLETEKEEAANLIAIVTEERDIARRKEEEYYEKFSEVSYDLEKLQESYVYINDRYHDCQDELQELRDQLSNLQELIANNPLNPHRPKPEPPVGPPVPNVSTAAVPPDDPKPQRVDPVPSKKSSKASTSTQRSQGGESPGLLFSEDDSKTATRVPTRQPASPTRKDREEEDDYQEDFDDDYEADGDFIVA